MSIKIYQVYYHDDQISSLDECFTPFENTHHPHPEWCEYGVFKKFFREKIYLQTEYCGIVSHRFNSKMHRSGKEVLQWIAQQEKQDVYVLNPLPHLQVYYNLWENGEVMHPGIKALAQSAFSASGYSIDLEQLPRTQPNQAAFCNYWVGNHRFWESFEHFVTPLVDHMLKRPEVFFAKTTYHSTGTFPFFPFIFERLAGTLLMKNSSFRSNAYPFPKEEWRNHILFEDFKNIYDRISEKIPEIESAPIENQKALFNENILRWFVPYAKTIDQVAILR